ncbi:MAG: glycerophosphodiester phosphodiesterase [Clostridia bacterium]|nr:glycerophosphodiester phosphodiesterase [Clostridia bacterium]
MTKIIAHRGANRYAPQNTMPAFNKAIELGIDGFENDVHLTKDGQIVICHNYTVDATSDGTGTITEMTFEELRALDFGSYFCSDFKGTKIPLLSEFFEICKGIEIINVEIKTPKKPCNIVSATVDLARKYRLDKNLLISSFSPDIVKECKEYAPDIKTGMLYDRNEKTYDEISKDPVAYCKALGCDAVHPMFQDVDENYIKEFHAAGMAVNPWTVDNPQDIVNLRDWGCDSVITNVPDIAASFLR